MRSPLLTLSGTSAFNVNNREDMFLIKSDHSCPDNGMYSERKEGIWITMSQYGN
jgi:hypothetical protein